MVDYGNDVWNYAFFLTKQADLSDDISQDTFLKVYEKIHTYRGGSSIKTWILSIVRNTVRDYWRSAWKKKVTLTEKLLGFGNHPSAEAEVLADTETKALWEIVLKLPLKLREVLVLYAHHQLSIGEIAALLQLSEGTVKSRLFRARAKVSKMMEQAEPGTMGGMLL
ncbi:sigma-70 family RNA polymerase sigma factor [Paenibacillus sp. MSJ-34]|nr:sigma-70 family RNA polymerase sigma factor [Paenibacillus sp. MSJ-34]